MLRHPHLKSVSSKKSIEICRPDGKRPRDCNNPKWFPTPKLTFEKTVALAKESTKVLVVDSTGMKHTTLLDKNEEPNNAILKAMQRKENILNYIRKDKSPSRNRKDAEDFTTERAENPLYKTRVPCSKCVGFSLGLLAACPACSGLIRNRPTQTLCTPNENENRMFYQVVKIIHGKPEAPAKAPKPDKSSNLAAGDGNSLNNPTVDPSSTVQKATGPNKEVQRHYVKNRSNQYTTANTQTDIMDDPIFAKNRTVKKFPKMESSRPKKVNGICALQIDIKKVTTIGFVIIALLVILFAAILFPYLKLVFGDGFSIHKLRAIINNLSNLPICAQNRKMKLPKTGIIRNFVSFLGNMFSK